MTYKEFLEKYGEEEVEFKSYYKYVFHFSNKNLAVSCGGCGEDIYRLDINLEPIKIQKLEPNSAWIDGEYYNFDY